MSEERFSKGAVDTLAKRAANTCSSPECGALTVGPASKPGRAVVVGEAAHIYGARPGSARFDSAMNDADRSDITNGIWLCRNCHKIIDADESRYPAELLFEWRREHEKDVLERLGKAGALRRKVIERKLEGFEDCSYLAQQIIIDRPEFWEFKLTAELLRAALSPIHKRWEALERGLYALPTTKLTWEEGRVWLSAAIDDAAAQTSALGELLNGELQASWGPPGEAGSEQDIYRVCGLIAEACQRLLEWEERLRFVSIAEPLENLPGLVAGACGPNLVKVCEVPHWLSSIFKSDPRGGPHELELIFTMPDGWNERISAEIKRANRRF